MWVKFEKNMVRKNERENIAPELRFDSKCLKIHSPLKNMKVIMTCKLIFGFEPVFLVLFICLL